LDWRFAATKRAAMSDAIDLVGPNNPDAVAGYHDTMLVREAKRLARVNEISGSPYHAAILRELVKRWQG
jgi:hypothetical protein